MDGKAIRRQKGLKRCRTVEVEATMKRGPPFLTSWEKYCAMAACSFSVKENIIMLTPSRIMLSRSTQILSLIVQRTQKGGNGAITNSLIPVNWSCTSVWIIISQSQEKNLRNLVRGREGTKNQKKKSEASDALWQLVGSSSAQFGQRSSFQVQQRHQGFLGDQFRPNTTANYIKPLLSHVGQPSVVHPPLDSARNEKTTSSQAPQGPSSQCSTGATAAVSSFSGFLQRYLGITSAGMVWQASYSTGFGAALNIETLVAAAERRDTPVEVLFKNLWVGMKDVEPILLKDRVHEVEANPYFSNKDISTSRAPVIAEVNSEVIPTMNQVDLPPKYTAVQHLVSNTMVEDEKFGAVMIPERVPSAQGMNQLLTIIPSSDSHININPKLTNMGSKSQFHRIIQMAMGKAIREIVSPVIQCSVITAILSTKELVQFHRIIQMAMGNAIREIVSPVIQCSVITAILSTKELVLKDYAMELDDNIISRAAHLMVGTSYGSTAHVTCKESLRGALSNYLRSLLQALNVNDERMVQIIHILTNDHLDLEYAMIGHVATQKVVELIDGEMAVSFAAIRKQRETAGSAYVKLTSMLNISLLVFPRHMVLNMVDSPLPNGSVISEVRDIIFKCVTRDDAALTVSEL